MAQGRQWLRTALLGGAAGLLLSGCTSFAPEAAAPAVVTAQPGDFGPNSVTGDYRPAAWWSDFEDPILDALVADALEGNFDLAAAAARVERANAQARISRSQLLPNVNATAGGSYRDAPLAGAGFPVGGGEGGPDRFTVEQYSIGVAAAYELDLFGRVRNDLEAARADARAAGWDYEAIQLATAAEVITTYFEIVDTRRQIELTLEVGELLTERVRQAEDRFARGLTQSQELYQLRQELRAVEAALPLQESALTAATSRLALLLGDYPREVRARLEAPLTPRLMMEDVPTGLPVELLAQRPDVAAAWNRLEANRFRIGARRAERFPQINLSGSLSTQGEDPVGAFNIIDNWVLSLAADLLAPIFSGGRISANIAAARASYDEAAANYAKAVVGAHGEVVAALERYEEQRQRYTLIQRQLGEAEAARDLASRRYAAGVGGYVAYLDALRGLAAVEQSLSTAARDVALARLGVHRALGGDWAPQAMGDDITLLGIETEEAIP